MDSWARFALVLGGGVGGSSESSLNSLTVSSMELDVEGSHLGRRLAIRFIPAKIQGRGKRTAGPGSVLVLSVSFEMAGLTMRKTNAMAIWLCWPSGCCWVPVRDEFNSRLELHIAMVINLSLATWLSSQMNGCLCRVHAPTLFILTFVFVSLVKFSVQLHFFDWHFGSHRRGSRGARS